MYVCRDIDRIDERELCLQISIYISFGISSNHESREKEEPERENPESGIMAAKPKLFYFHGRGRMESIRWLLAAAGVEFEEEFLETREQYERMTTKLQKDGRLLFGQVPLVEMDGMMLTQMRAILSYLAAKYNLYGKDLKERVRIDMYVDGTLDLMMMIAVAAFKTPQEKEESLALTVKKAKTRYFPVFEKILKSHGEGFLVGNKFSWADIQLLEAILMMEELDASILSDFPLLKAFKTRISNIPTIKAFLQPGSQRKQPPDSHYVQVVRDILQF
ncbi:Glutathione S-transferase A4 [Galemys pyrenaicus]|uniref:glutathione transferase n=1 Tax=Galemys pyrenaicus TaxID=202257 RepID=A0A8J6DT56_GALPY|nr:Glutathione S-transferase A4 [Galemys pyrenaicus]